LAMSFSNIDVPFCETHYYYSAEYGGLFYIAFSDKQELSVNLHFHNWHEVCGTNKKMWSGVTIGNWGGDFDLRDVSVWIGTLNGTKKWDPDNCCGGDPVKTLIFSCEDGSNCIGNQTWTFLPPPMTSAALEKIFHAFEYLKKQVGTHKDPF
jgi:hypothetical protein